MKHGDIAGWPVSMIFFSWLVVGAVSCGGGGGGGTDDDTDDGEEDAAGGIVDENGDTITAVDTADSVNLALTGLNANAQYNITVTGPDGTALSPSGGFVATTDEDGAISSSTIIQDLSTTEDNADLILYTRGIVPRVTADTGEYEITVTNDNGDEVFSTSLDVEDRSKVYCADSAGTARASFLPTQSVYAKVEAGDGDLADGTYTCYAFSDLSALLATGDTLAGTTAAVTVVGGEGTVNLGMFSTTGGYDVVCDVDADGLYTTGTDLISRPARFRPCFTIQNANSGADIIGQICSDRSGNYRDIFDPNATDDTIRDVWAWISPGELSLVQHAIGVCKYVVDHQDDWTDGDALTDVDATIEVDPVQGFCTNESPWLVWPRQNLVAGCYDCIIDVDCDGVYDRGTDFIDNIDNTGDNDVGGMCVASTACEDSDVVITSHSDGDTVSTTAITLAGTFSEAVTNAKVIVTAGTSSNTITIDASSGSFSASIPLFSGANKITVAGTQSNGVICSETITITSSSSSSDDELFRVQLTWDGDTDMDIHLVQPGGSYDNGSAADDLTDCNFDDCQVGLDGSGSNGVDWGTVGSEDDDPKLDVDCQSCGNGIENIWMNEINDDGSYTVYVDAYTGSESDVHVTVFIRGATVATVDCGAMSAGSATTDSCFVGTIAWSGGSSGNGTFTADGSLASDF